MLVRSLVEITNLKILGRGGERGFQLSGVEYGCEEAEEEVRMKCLMVVRHDG